MNVANEIAAMSHPAAVADELAAMKAIAEGFAHIDVRARRRALEWADSRYGGTKLATEGLLSFMAQMLEAIGAHQKATKQPRQIDRDLWEATIKGSVYWSEPDPESKS